MATGSSKRDAQVLDMIRRTGIGVRELLRVALGGVDPNNILQRLSGRGLIRTVKGLPQNRAYYMLGREKPLGPQALHQRLALAWHLCMNDGAPACILSRAELAEIFGLQAPSSGTHLLEARAQAPRVIHVYVPETVEVIHGITRHVERAVTSPALKKAMHEGRYAFLTLCPWRSDLHTALRQASAGKGIAGVPAKFIPQAKAILELRERSDLLFAEAPSAITLSLALKTDKENR